MSDFWQGKRVLVTGGSGFIGSFVAEQLVARGARVSVTVHAAGTPNLAAVRDRITILQGDLQNADFTNKALQDQEIVIHLASLKRNIEYHRAHPADLLRVNTLIAINILEACQAHGIGQLMVVSTNLIDKRVLDDERAPHYGYAWSKYFSEVLAKAYRVQYGLNIIIARPNNVYGPRDNFIPEDAQVVPSLIARAVAGQDPLVVFGDGTAARPFAYVEDVAEALVTLLETPQEHDLFDITGAEHVRISELVETVLKLTGRTGAKLGYTVAPPVTPPALPTSPPSDGQAIKLSRRLEDGLARTVEWYRSEHKGSAQ